MRTRFCSSVILPFLAIEKNFQSAVPPKKDMLSTLAKGAVQPALGEPFINGLDALAEQSGKLCGRDDRRIFSASERAGDLLFSQWPSTRAHRANPFACALLSMAKCAITS